MKEVIFYSAPCCKACPAMHDWFFTIEIPEILFREIDNEKEPDDSIVSVPTIIFKENGHEVQRITGALNKADLVRKIYSIFEI